MDAHRGHAGGRCIFGRSPPIALWHLGQLVMAEIRFHVHDRTQRTFADPPPQFNDGGLVAPLVSNPEMDSRLTADCNRSLGLRTVQRKRLLTEDVLPGACNRAYLSGVFRVRRRENDGVDRGIAQHVHKVGCERDIVFAREGLTSGICLNRYGDKWLGDPAFDDVFAELNRRRAIVYVHPATPGCCTKLMPHVPPFLTEFIQETNRAITSLMYSGSLSRYPDIRFIFSHAGGGIPVLAGRIAQLGSAPHLAAKVPEGVETLLKRQYFEIANSANAPAIAALTSIIPPTNIMFGSDFPLVPLSATADGLSKLGLTEALLQALRRDNAFGLMPTLKR